MCKVKLNISHADIFFGSFWQQPAMQCTLVHFVQILSGVNSYFKKKSQKMITLISLKAVEVGINVEGALFWKKLVH